MEWEDLADLVEWVDLVLEWEVEKAGFVIYKPRIFLFMLFTHVLWVVVNGSLSLLSAQQDRNEQHFTMVTI